MKDETFPIYAWQFDNNLQSAFSFIKALVDSCKFYNFRSNGIFAKHFKSSFVFSNDKLRLFIFKIKNHHIQVFLALIRFNFTWDRTNRSWKSESVDKTLIFRNIKQDNEVSCVENERLVWLVGTKASTSSRLACANQGFLRSRLISCN